MISKLLPLIEKWRCQRREESPFYWRSDFFCSCHSPFDLTEGFEKLAREGHLIFILLNPAIYPLQQKELFIVGCLHVFESSDKHKNGFIVRNANYFPLKGHSATKEQAKGLIVFSFLQRFNISWNCKERVYIHNLTWKRLFKIYKFFRRTSLKRYSQAPH